MQHHMSIHNKFYMRVFTELEKLCSKNLPEPVFDCLCRFINMLNMLNTYLFTAIALIVAIFQCAKYDLPRDYGVHGTNADKAFGVFQGIVIMHFVYG